MELISGDRHLSVAKSATDYLILEEPTQLSPGEAELIVTVDDEPTKFHFTIVEPVDGVRVELGATNVKDGITAESAVA